MCSAASPLTILQLMLRESEGTAGGGWTDRPYQPHQLHFLNLPRKTPSELWTPRVLPKFASFGWVDSGYLHPK